jgi:LacI family transcriptional regulator
MSQKIRLKHIAEALEISITTVFRALKDGDGVSEKTKSLVFKEAEKMGYNFDGLSKENSKKERVSVAILCPFDIFFKTVVSGMESAREILGNEDINIEFKFLEVYDVVKQSEQLREILENKNYDCIAIAPSHPLVLNPLIDELVENGTIVITFNTDAPNSKRSLFIGQDAYIAGKMVGQILGMKSREGDYVAYFTSFVPTAGVKGRTDGFVKMIDENYQQLRILGPFEYNDYVDEATSLARQVILNTPRIDFMFANNMVGTLGCARAVKETGNQGKIFVGGFDQNDEINQLINEDIILATILQDPYNQGFLTIKTLLNTLNKDINMVKELYTGCELLMKSNIELYRDKKY